MMHNILDRFQIGEPIQSLFKPKFELSDPDSIRLTISARDTTNPRQTIRVSFTEHIPPIAQMSDTQVFAFLRHMLHKMLKHEADESILVDGCRVFDPHEHR